MKVKFYYDYICPFCYIGTNRMLDIAGEMDLEIEWIGIEIHPEYPAQGKKRKNSPRLIHITETLNEIAAEDNTEIELPGFVTNSRLCLEAAELCKKEGRFIEFHKNVYNSFFRNRENIGDPRVIEKIATRSDIDPDKLMERLKKREMRKRIDENKKLSESDMVLGVPTIFFNDFRLHGVQSIRDFKNIIMNETEREMKRRKQ